MEDRGRQKEATYRHTPGPWKAGPLTEDGLRRDRQHVYVDVFCGGRKIARVSAYGKRENGLLSWGLKARGKTPHIVSETEVKANARRLVATVNALEGISTRTLEKIAGCNGNVEVRSKGKIKPFPLRRLVVALAAVGGIPTLALEDGVLTAIVRLAAIGLRTLEHGPSEDVTRFCRGRENRALSQARTCIALHGKTRGGANA